MGKQNVSYKTVLEQPESTVVAAYESNYKTSRKEKTYQSEAALEDVFIKLLAEQGYTYLKIHTNEDLVRNLRTQLEKLNDYKFTDDEWERFFSQSLANSNEHVVEKTRKIQEDYRQVLRRDDGTTKNITLIDKKNVHKNSVQVINQYNVPGKEGTDEYDAEHRTNRYDVTILVNGFPLVHIELKRRGVALKQAFNQIERYQRESFWRESGLYEYVQIFVISNGTNTKYYSNTTRENAVKEYGKKNKKKRTSNSFEFTSYWADAENHIISDLMDFTKTFFAKHSILNILTKYCILTSENVLMVMRPYQIVATERILNKIEIASNYKMYGKTDGGGYIWHTTGSGKTLTSFKTAQLASGLSNIDKVLFVVDRKDLDYQTMKEYERFEKGAANGNKSTAVLQRQLEDKDKNGNHHEYKIIITTIQKLDNFVSRNQHHEVYGKHVVMIFDECHRSQFGGMHKAIVKKFKKYHIFGFTGTPIFAENAGTGSAPDLKTTEQAFGERLHTYTVVDAINDGNVLPFKVDYINTIKKKPGLTDEQVEAINTEKALLAPKRISEVVRYVIEHFDSKTKRGSGTYKFSKLTNIEEVAKDSDRKELKISSRLSGFNSIFAVSSIDAAKAYYMEFKRQLAELQGEGLRIATIYSYGVNEDIDDPTGLPGDEDSDSTDGLDQSSRDFLEMAISDYNEMFGTSYDTSQARFPNYYKDLSLRMKNKEIDILIVVNMFLTGFDATTLNTLWVDKNLKMHGLIQAFSRTNRILNSVKTFGNIVCFRDLQEETDSAIALFGDKEAKSVVLLKTYNEYYYGYEDEKGHQKGYEERIAELLQKYPLGDKPFGEEAEKEFIVSFGNILRLKNILTTFDEFPGNEILSQMDFQDYTGLYNDLYDKWRPRVNKEDITDDIVFEMELVRQVEVNIDYILALVMKYHESNMEDKEIMGSIDRAIKSSLELRSKKELIENFIDTIDVDTKVAEDWKKYVEEQRKKDTEALIADENLKPDETRRFIENAFRDGEIKTTGTEIDGIMPPTSRFFGGANRLEKKETVIEKLKKFFDKYFGLV